MDTASLNGRRFVNVSSGGVGAEATAETPTQAKATLGSLAYAITGVRKIAGFAPYRGRFRGDDFDLDGEFLLFGAGNGRATGRSEERGVGKEGEERRGGGNRKEGQEESQK